MEPYQALLIIFGIFGIGIIVSVIRILKSKKDIKINCPGCEREILFPRNHSSKELKKRGLIE